MDETKSIIWRIWLAIALTSAGVFYYLVFLFYLAAGVPIEKIHYFMTDGWPNFCADNVPLVAPVFLCVGLYFWYTYVQESKPKVVAEPEYAFEFTKVEKPTEHSKGTDYVFDSKANRMAKTKTVTTDNETGE